MFKNLQKLFSAEKTGESKGYRDMSGVSSGSLSSYIWKKQDTSPPRYGTSELLNAYSNLPRLRAVTNKIGKAVSTTEWKLYTVKDKNNKKTKLTKCQRAYDDAFRKKLIQEKQQTVFDVDEIEDHPLLDLLYNGNDQIIGQSNIQLTQTHLDLVGESFWILERDGLGTPVSIWVIPPDWVVDFPRKDHPYYKVRMGNKQADVPVTEIIPFIDPDPSNPYGRGSGIAKSLGDELETDEYAARHVKSFFYNRARPDIIISGDGLSRSNTDRLEEAWLQKHKGFWNSFKPHFMNRKVEVKELGQSFNDMNLVELRKFERDAVIETYGVPPEKMGLINSSNRSSITAADLFWQRDIVAPRLDYMRFVLQKYLVPKFDDTLILDYQSPIVEDKELEMEVMSKAPYAFTKNEWRQMANRPSLGDRGDTFVMRPGEIEVPMDQEIDEPTQYDEDDEKELQNLNVDEIQQKVQQRLLQKLKKNDKTY